jgi:hypothetical protein
VIRFLWNNRERPRFLSKRYFVVWAKRMLNAYGLFRIFARRYPHVMRGVRVGELSIVYGL